AILMLNCGRGSGEVARQQARYLLSQGHQIYFIQPQAGSGLEGAFDREVKLHGDVLPVHEYLPSADKQQKAVATMSYEEAVAYLPAYENALEAVIREVDVVIGHHANITATATCNIAERHAKPYVLFLHGTGIEPRHQGLYDDQVWGLIESAVESADGIIVTTEYVRDHLVRNLIDLPTSRFIVLPCGINVSEFHPDNTQGILEKYALPERYVICPGALTAAKGPQNVVAASEHYADLAPTIFIGDGELREELETKLGDRGRFLGFVSAEDKAKLINAATLLVAAPEKKEHFGIIYAEALSGGTPTVAYEGGGVSSIVTPETGVLTERNTAELGQAVQALLGDAEQYAMMTKASRTRGKTLFCHLMLGARLEKWLSGICAA
ncbi:MAG: glycosyltransferase family 4 protein, partial [Opitutales bacterium]